MIAQNAAPSRRKLCKSLLTSASGSPWAFSLIKSSLLLVFALTMGGHEAMSEVSVPHAVPPVPHRYTPPAPLGGARLSGRIESISRAEMVLALRSGQLLRVDLTAAIKNHLSIVPYVGEFVQVEGVLSPQGVLKAESVGRVKSNPASWEPDIH
jgi:hypothetical protein